MLQDKEGSIIIRNDADFKAYLASRTNKKLYETKDGRMVVDHVAVANVMSKFIELCPMDRWIKRVMLMRVGSPLLRKKAMSHMQIALVIGATVDEVIEMEKHGKYLVGMFLERCNAAEAVEKFDRLESNKKHIDEVNNSLLNPQSEAGGKGDSL